MNIKVSKTVSKLDKINKYVVRNDTWMIYGHRLVGDVNFS